MKPGQVNCACGRVYPGSVAIGLQCLRQGRGAARVSKTCPQDTHVVLLLSRLSCCMRSTIICMRIVPCWKGGEAAALNAQCQLRCGMAFS